MTTVCVGRESIQTADLNESYGQRLSRRFMQVIGAKLRWRRHEETVHRHETRATRDRTSHCPIIGP